MKLAPAIAGFSEEACDMYSGVYCEYPVDCSVLVSCVEAEKSWASDNSKAAYEQYLDASPNVADTTDGNECGELREYFVSP